MKKIVLFFLLLLQSVILPQNIFIRQITNGDYDARNPFIYKDEYGFNNSLVFFELHKDGYSNIYSAYYNPNNLMFEDTVAITIGSDININPSFEANSGLIYQTNKNGNWDIVLIPDSNGIFSNPIFLTSSSEDEYSAKILESTYPFSDSVHILFKRQNEIVFLSYKNNQINEEAIFKDSLNHHYTEFAGLKTEDWGNIGGYYVFAIEESDLFQKRIVRRFKPFGGVWQPKTIVVDNCDCSNISLQTHGYVTWALFYQDTTQTERRLFWVDDAVSVTTPQLINIDYEGNISSFDMYSLLLVGDNLNNSKFNPDFYMPYTYLINNNGGTKIRVNKYDHGYWSEDSLVNVSIVNPNLTVGPVGIDNGAVAVYTIWEDSIDGHIHLFGAPAHLEFGAVEDESYANDFVLYQNYPNPFNPTTKIEYKLLQASDVKFNVFNILGEKVFEQDLGYQTAGSYKVNFDGRNLPAGRQGLPSGVYIYSIYTSENRLSRKMMLMK